jgi:hypothetical protein
MVGILERLGLVTEVMPNGQWVLHRKSRAAEASPATDADGLTESDREWWKMMILDGWITETPL